MSQLILIAGVGAVAVALPLLASSLGNAVSRGAAGVVDRRAVLAGVGMATRPADRRPLPTIARLGTIGRRLMPRSRIEATTRLLDRAGHPLRIEYVDALRAAGVLALIPLAVAVGPGGPTGLAGMLALGAVAVVWPDVWLRRLGERRAESIARSLSDSLDLLAISVEAGAGFDGALARVAECIEGPLGDEYGRALDEMALGLSRREALLRLKERIDLPELSSFVLAVVQADAMGAAMSGILRIQAQEMRAKRRRTARERAAKTPVKILFPLVFGIFPAMLVVILGPAVIRILEMIAAQ